MNRASLTAADVMQVGIKTVLPGLTLPQLEAAFVRDRVTGYPVVEQSKLIGVVSRSDVIRQLCTEREVAERVSDFHFDETDFYEVKMESLQQIADRVGERIESLTVADVMNGRPLTVPPHMPIKAIAHELIRHRVHRLPVSDHGDLLGLVSSTDLVRLIADGRIGDAH
jgi:CBS domain-containing protein